MSQVQVSLEVSKQALNEMSTDKFKSDFGNLIKCRYPLFYVTTNEEKRFIQFMEHFCRVNGRECHVWNSYEGMIDQFSGSPSAGVSEDVKNNALAILDHIISQGKSYEHSKTSVDGLKGKGTKGIIFVLLDFFRFIREDPDVERRLKSVAALNTIISVIITGPYYKATDTLENLIPVVDFPYANRNEIKHALYDVVTNIEDKIPEIREITKEKEEVLLNSVSGLTLMEAQTAFSKSIVSTKGWHIPTILEEKRQIISKNGLLEYFDKTVDLKDVGGLKNLVGWIKKRKSCFTKEAEEYGLRKPRGAMFIGISGCGKSYIAKAISGYWESPLLRLDMGKLFQSHVGESEQNARAAIKLAEAVAPCVIGSTEIIIDGLPIYIDRLFDREKNNDKNEFSVFKEGNTDTQYIVYMNKEKDVKIRSTVDNNIKDINLKAITKTFKNEKLIKIRTKSGKKIIATNNHLLMGEVELKKMSDFKLNDIVSIVNNEGIEKDEITMLESINFEGYVYDACCEGPHLYITNNFVSHNCILWVDEIEKSISGGQSSGRLDSGVTSRVLSTFLTWLQEKDSSVFVVATANDHQSIPPEFLRAGRFDEIFFVDLPNLDERKEIFEVHLRKKKLNIKNFDPTSLATASNGYSGAEIEKSIENAMLIGFDDDRRKIGTIDILNALKGFKPLSVMREGEFDELRDWAKNRCVKASLDSTSTPLYNNLKPSKDLEV